MQSLFENHVFLSSLIAAAAAQLFKVLFSLFFSRKINLKQALSTGGMPSSHTATVSALTMSVWLVDGAESTLFAVALVLSVIVIYDAVGIRRAAGKHAELLNEWSRLLSELFEHGFKPEDLKTLLGHTYPQVFAGMLLGIATALAVHYL